MRDVSDIRNEFEDRPAYEPSGKKSKPKKAKSRVDLEKKSKQPTAPARESELGQYWFDLGVQSGFEFPFNANYFALALAKRIDSDREIQAITDLDQVDRWVRKMVEIWWDPVNEHDQGGYLTGDVTARNAKEMFLVNDWDDLRDYARSCLRAAYLREHGRRVEPPLDTNSHEYRDRLDALRARHEVTNLHRKVDETPEREVQLDEARRERLRAWRETRSQK